MTECFNEQTAHVCAGVGSLNILESKQLLVQYPIIVDPMPCYGKEGIRGTRCTSIERERDTRCEVLEAFDEDPLDLQCLCVHFLCDGRSMGDLGFLQLRSQELNSVAQRRLIDYAKRLQLCQYMSV